MHERILTPRPSPFPHISGARVIGIRPGSPAMHTIAATGVRPMTFDADTLPRGLDLDPETGRITGKTRERGTCRVKLHARNREGKTNSELKIVVGDKLALTPPMGWNSWNCFAGDVTDRDIRATADALVTLGLVQHGWSYVNIDDAWACQPGKTDPVWKFLASSPRQAAHPDKPSQSHCRQPMRDKRGRINANSRFPDMRGLTNYIHSLGLKAGIYSSPGPLTCGGFLGSYGREEQDATRFAEWCFDYLKYDWCSYGKIAKNNSFDEQVKPYKKMGDALRKQKRDIVYSLSPRVNSIIWEWGRRTGGQCWRTTNDIVDTWASVSEIGFSHEGIEYCVEPGQWNDADMLVVGHVGWGRNTHPTRLTPDEQYTHISLWCLLASPLFIGCDLTRADDFTLSLLTNDEVLAVNQDPLGKQAARVSRKGHLEVWAKDMEDGSKAAGMINRGESEHEITVHWSDVGVRKTRNVRDLWRQKNLGKHNGNFTASVPPHGTMLIRIG